MTTKRFSTAAAFLVVSITSSNNATAVVITYDAEHLTGNTWTYHYTLTNNSSFPVQEFTVLFEPAAFSNLAFAQAPVGWDPLIVQPSPSIPDDGFYDALKVSGEGVAVGGTVSGFSVSFNYLGSGSPGTQPFEIVDPVTFNTLEQGATTPVPVSPSVLLLLSGLACFWIWRPRTGRQFTQIAPVLLDLHEASTNVNIEPRYKYA